VRRASQVPCVSLEFDRAMMERALFHAARGAGRTAPNPMVGAVIVTPDGIVAAHGWHERAGEPHAEVNAIEESGALARGATLYVTLEPCCHVGRTGPCTRRIIEAGIARVVAAMQDPDPRVSGQGFAELRAHGIDVAVGLGGDEAARLNRAFVTTRRDARPLVVMKAAASLDARVAEAAMERTAISSPAANRRSQALRASVDAIAVGSDTMLADDPLLTARDHQRIRPLVRVIFDRRLRTPIAARLFSTLDAGPVIIMAGPHPATDRARALQGVGAVVVTSADLADSLRQLLGWDVATLLLEGGPTLQRAFCEAGLVDRLHLVVAPRVLGRQGTPWLDTRTLPCSSLALVSAEPRGDDVWIEADVHRNHRSDRHAD
jgi:diaminohydroxyphosphoribosylaminopyrimidine deaminase / 5-amino-6-(5-phosphoribosylamino)uracil reductase